MRRFTKLLIFISMLAIACSCGKQKELAESGPRRVSAATVLVSRKPVYDGRSFPGKVEAKNKIVLASRISAYVISVHVDEADHVKKGEVLIDIDDKEIRERISSLEATLSQIRRQRDALTARLLYARSQFRRYMNLLQEEAATKEEFEKTKSEYEAILKQIEAASAREKSVKAQIEQVKASLDYTRITSPTDGTVTGRLVDPGTFVTAGQPLLVIEAPRQGYWFRANVDEGLLRSVKKIPGVAVAIPSAGIFFFTNEVLVIPEIDLASHTFSAKVDISRSGLDPTTVGKIKNGMFGRLIWLSRIKEKLAIPKMSIIKRGEIEGVYVVDENKRIHFRVIKSGAVFSEAKIRHKKVLVPIDTSIARKAETRGKFVWVEVLSGLKTGEKIIASNLDSISEGYILK